MNHNPAAAPELLFFFTRVLFHYGDKTQKLFVSVTDVAPIFWLNDGFSTVMIIEADHWSLKAALPILKSKILGWQYVVKFKPGSLLPYVCSNRT